MEYNSAMMGDGTSPRQIAIGAVALVVFIAFVYTLANTRFSAPSPTATSSPNVTEIPPLTPMMKAVLEKSKGFEALVSYTDRGFEPADVAVTKGETVRFTNNSSGDLWVAATGASGRVYPSTGNECGQSAFDSCIPLSPREFWEFTFEVAGVWSYTDNLHKKKTGVVRTQ